MFSKDKFVADSENDILYQNIKNTFLVMMSDLFKVTTDYILKGVEPEPAVHKNHIQFLYIGCAIVFAVIAGIWSYASNRFAPGECILIVLAGAAVGLGVSLVIHVISGLLRSAGQKIYPDCLVRVGGFHNLRYVFQNGSGYALCDRCHHRSDDYNFYYAGSGCVYHATAK